MSCTRVFVVALALAITAQGAASAQRRGRRGKGNNRRPTAAPAVQIAAAPRAVQTVAGVPVRVTLQVRNPATRRVNVRLGAQAPKGWKVRFQRAQFALAPRGVVQEVALIQPPKQRPDKPVTITFHGGGQQPGGGGGASVRVTIVDPLVVEAVLPAFGDRDNPYLELVVRNPLAVDMRLAAEARCSKGPTFAPIDKSAILVRKQSRAAIPLAPTGTNVNAGRLYTVAYQLTVAGGISVTGKAKVSFTPCLRAMTPPQIDGSLEEWGDLGAVELGACRQAADTAERAENLIKPKALLRWDADNLYLGLRLPGGEGVKAGKLTVVGGVTALKRIVLQPTGKSEGRKAPLCASQSGEAALTYEARIPWSSLGVKRMRNGGRCRLALTADVGAAGDWQLFADLDEKTSAEDLGIVTAITSERMLLSTGVPLPKKDKKKGEKADEKDEGTTEPTLGFPPLE